MFLCLVGFLPKTTGSVYDSMRPHIRNYNIIINLVPFPKDPMDTISTIITKTSTVGEFTCFVRTRRQYANMGQTGSSITTAEVGIGAVQPAEVLPHQVGPREARPHETRVGPTCHGRL